MSIGLILIISIPILFVIGTIYSALKEQKKLEEGELSKILKERKMKNKGH